MVLCEVDKEVSGAALGWRLPVWQSLLYHRLIPSSCGLVVYITFICYDFALIYEFYNCGEQTIGAISILLAVFPAIASFIFTLASPPPGFYTEEESALNVVSALQTSDWKWLLTQFFYLLLFPIAAIGRYCYLIFWSMEAVCASYTEDKERTNYSLRRIHEPSPIELYLFLQAFVHCPPRALINIVLLMTSNGSYSYDKTTIQAVNIITALMRMASTATIYRRFQREKICGRKYPWSVNSTYSDETIKTMKIVEEKDSLRNHNEVESIDDDPNDNRLTLTNNLYNIAYRKETKSKSYSFINDLVGRVSTDSDYLVPIDKERSTTEEQKPIWDKSAPKRSTRYNIEENITVPPPAIQAPSRKSLAVAASEWAEYIMENAESFPDRIAAPHRARTHDDEEDNPPLPERVPRNFQRGLEPQDATAAIVSYFAWHLFFISRMLSIAVFIRFYTFYGIIVVMCHYQLMLLLLIVPQAPTVKRTFYLFLAFVYIFCLIEFKIRFRHVRLWHIFWFSLCTVETVIFTAVWAMVDESTHFWWKNYVLTVIYSSTILSYGCMLVFYALLKPKETIVYNISKE